MRRTCAVVLQNALKCAPMRQNATRERGPWCAALVTPACGRAPQRPSQRLRKPILGTPPGPCGLSKRAIRLLAFTPTDIKGKTLFVKSRCHPLPLGIRAFSVAFWRGNPPRARRGLTKWPNPATLQRDAVRRHSPDVGVPPNQGPSDGSGDQDGKPTRARHGFHKVAALPNRAATRFSYGSHGARTGYEAIHRR